MKMNKKGATIIEIIIYTFLSLTLLLTLTEIFSGLLDKSKESVSFSEVETDARFINQKILNDFSRAVTVTSPPNLNSPSESLSFNDGVHTYSYFQSGANLNLVEDGIIDRLNSFGTEVSGFTVSRFGNPGGKSLLKISFNLKSTIIQPKGFEEKTVNLSIGTR